MNNEKNIDTIIAELNHIYEIYQRYESFDNKMENVKSHHRAEKNAITSATKDKMKSYEKKRRTKINVPRPTVDKALWTPIPALPEIPSSKNHTKTIIMGAASGLAIPVGLVLYFIFMFLNESLSFLGGALLLGGLFVWFLCGGHLAVETYQVWRREILEYDKKMREWESAYSKLDLSRASDNLMTDVAVYEKEFLSMVKDCDSTFGELFNEMLEEKSKLSKRHIAELEELKQEWNEICSDLESVTLIHSDLFYIAWRISSALERGRANTLQEAINVAIDDERIAREEATRQAEARRQEAILQRQAEEQDRRYREEKQFRERQESERKRDEEYARKEQERKEREESDRAKSEAKRRCHWCKNYRNCGIRHNPPQMCTGFQPSSTHQI